MSEPTHIERCKDEYSDDGCKHHCSIEAGHEGPHECPCGADWENESSDATGFARGKNILAESTPPWETAGYGVVSLLAMLEFSARGYVEIS